MANRWGKSGRLYFFGLQNHCRWWLQPWNKKTLTPWKESYDLPRQPIKKQRHYFANKGPSSQGYGFSSGHVFMWGLDYKESWAPKNWCFLTVVARVNVNILGISKLKWTGMSEFNSDDHYIYYCGQESLRRNGVAIIVNKSPKCSPWMQSQKQQNDLCSFPRQTIQYHSN